MKQLETYINKIDFYIDKYNFRTFLLAVLLIIFSVYCFISWNQINIVKNQTVTTPKTEVVTDTFITVSQNNKAITIPNATPPKKIAELPKKTKKSLKKSGNLLEGVNNKQSKFILGLKKVILIEAEKYKIPASIKMAQSALESGWGEDILAKKANNIYSIKHKNKYTPKEEELIVGRIKHKTSEFFNNKKVQVNDEFIVYPNRWSSIRHHSIMLRNRIDTEFNKGYAKMKKLKITDYKGWAKALEDANYSTNPDYAETLIEIIETYKLYKLDK